ncbi:hypothetical protein ABZ436_25555 [Micromonospora matsumotoense]|uniref:hypothetical protein n=1 Tax=Micromonospora matsumotoense TaxID=121616 RepID=UPI0033EFC1EA
MKVVLRAAQVERERVFQKVEAGKCSFQPVDRVGGGLELLVQPVGHLVGGCPFGE